MALLSGMLIYPVFFLFRYEVQQSSLFNKPENLSRALSVCEKSYNEKSYNENSPN